MHGVLRCVCNTVTDKNPRLFSPNFFADPTMSSLLNDRNIYSLGVTESIEPMKQIGKVMEQFRVAENGQSPICQCCYSASFYFILLVLSFLFRFFFVLISQIP